MNSRFQIAFKLDHLSIVTNFKLSKTISLLIYLFSGVFYKSYGEDGKLFDLAKMPKLPLLVLVLVVFFVLARGLMGDITGYLGTGMIEVRPSWQATWDITQSTLKDNLLLLICQTL